MAALFHKGAAHVKVKRISHSPPFFGTVQHRDFLDRLWDRIKQVFDGEGTEQANLHKTHLLSLAGQVVDHLLDGLARRPHGDDDLIRILCSHIVEQIVTAAGEVPHPLHVPDHHVRHLHEIGVGRLDPLKIDVRVLGRPPKRRGLRIDPPGTETRHRVHVRQFGHVRVVDDLHLLDLMGGPEAVEKMHERYARVDG